MRCGCTPASAKISKIFRDLLFCLQKKGFHHWIARFSAYIGREGNDQNATCHKSLACASDFVACASDFEAHASDSVARASNLVAL